MKSKACWLLAACALWLLMPLAAALGQTNQKINLSIFYTGHPGSAREADFVQFLRAHFNQVATGDLATFDGAQSPTSDEVILDYDGDGFSAPRPNLPNSYSRPTITVGVVGGFIGNQLGLKTGYM
ncbi:MAG: hypothetical protein ABSB42_06430 [Tepidisphaeraceae bacterium]|jgi:hypothetical protein